MKQIEITVRLVENIEDAIAKLEKNGFKKTHESDIADIYLSNLDIEIKRKNIQELLKHSVLLRNIKFDGKEIKKITYTNKALDKNGDLLPEQQATTH